MLEKNIKRLRKQAGMSQEELAIRLTVVRQTVSKWEQGLSVPDSDLLIALSEALETPVSTLLGETIVETDADRLTAISEKLEVINLQLAQIKCSRRKVIHWLFIAFSAAVVALLALLLLLNSLYQHWDYSDPETAALGTIYHSLEWLFARVWPFLLAGGVTGAVLTRKRN